MDLRSLHNLTMNVSQMFKAEEMYTATAKWLTELYIAIVKLIPAEFCNDLTTDRVHYPFLFDCFSLKILNRSKYF